MSDEKIFALVSGPGVYLVTGPSGSGKTTFVEMFKPHIYMSQYHAVRPEGFVYTFFKAEELKLPYTVSSEQKIGGQHMPGLDVKGLSGGQRKLFIVAMINAVLERNNTKMLVVVDEPLAGVTADYCPFITNLVTEWGGKGHKVLVIDNDHHEITTNSGWNRIKVASRTMVEYNGTAYNLPVPMVKKSRRSLPKNLYNDVMLYLRHDMFNMESLNNVRLTQAGLLQVFTVPFTYRPTIDMGAVLMLFAFLFIVMNTNWGFTPGRIVQYNRVQNEAQVGLITDRAATVFFIMAHDLIMTSLLIIIIMVIQATGFGISRYDTWDLCWAGLLFNMNFALASMYPALSGAPFSLCALVQTIVPFMFFFFGGTLSPSYYVGTKVTFLSAPTAYVQLLTGRAAFPPNTSLEASALVETVFAVLWLCLDAFFLFLPYLTAASADNRANRSMKQGKGTFDV